MRNWFKTKQPGTELAVSTPAATTGPAPTSQRVVATVVQPNESDVDSGWGTDPEPQATQIVVVAPAQAIIIEVLPGSAAGFVSEKDKELVRAYVEDGQLPNSTAELATLVNLFLQAAQDAANGCGPVAVRNNYDSASERKKELFAIASHIRLLAEEVHYLAESELRRKERALQRLQEIVRRYSGHHGMLSDRLPDDAHWSRDAIRAVYDAAAATERETRSNERQVLRDYAVAKHLCEQAGLHMGWTDLPDPV